VDFDETASEHNVAELLLGCFAQDGWKELQADFRAGAISLRTYQEEAYRKVPTSIEELASYAATHARLRAGFAELAEACRSSRTPITVVSGGLDFYVRAVLTRNNLSWLPFTSAVVQQNADGLQFGYPHTTESCWQTCNCKCQQVRRFQAQGYKVVYAGDGRNDACPASKAQYVFARKRLLEHCAQEGLPHEPLEDFHQVLRALRDPRHPVHAHLMINHS
jgi:2,3-diketo-5-methylthio-1-phosphopentane phosphatase